MRTICGCSIDEVHRDIDGRLRRAEQLGRTLVAEAVHSLVGARTPDFALHEARMPAMHQTYRAGLAYLLSTQAADGTWHVRTRALPFQPYFESGYPYGPDQWISAAAAAYATLALSAAVDVPHVAAR